MNQYQRICGLTVNLADKDYSAHTYKILPDRYNLSQTICGQLARSTKNLVHLDKASFLASMDEHSRRFVTTYRAQRHLQGPSHSMTIRRVEKAAGCIIQERPFQGSLWPFQGSLWPFQGSLYRLFGFLSAVYSSLQALKSFLQAFRVHWGHIQCH